jgi:hypothetical protein
MNLNLYCMKDHDIVVYYLIVKGLVFLLVYTNYKLLGRLYLNLVLDVFWCKFVFCLRLSMFQIDSWTMNYLKSKWTSLYFIFIRRIFRFMH